MTSLRSHHPSNAKVRCSFSFSAAAAALGFLVLLVVPEAASAQTGTYATLYNFTGGADGAEPTGGVIAGPDGTLYGETSIGGAATCAINSKPVASGCGTVYSYNTTSGLTVLASFAGPNGAYGNGGLTLVGSTLYGTAAAGGASNAGLVFSLHTDGTSFKILHQFTGTDGSQPSAPLRVGPGGVLYGLAQFGGAGNDGVFFSLTPGGTYTILHSFSGGTKDGAYPTTLLVSTNGTLVGSTRSGGNTNPKVCYGCGMIFEYVPSTKKYTEPYFFSGTAGFGGYIGSVGAGPTVYGNDGTAPFALNMTSGLVNFEPFEESELGSVLSGPLLTPGGTLIGVQSVGPQSIGDLYSTDISTGVTTQLAAPDYPDAQPILMPSGQIIGTAVEGGLCQECGAIFAVTP